MTDIYSGESLFKPIMEIAATVERQWTFFRSGETRSLEFRRAELVKLGRAIEANEQSLYSALRADLGKSAYEAYMTELGFVLSELRHALRHLPAWMRPQRRRTPWLAWPARGFVRPEPYGVALIIGPWNYPFQLLFAPLVGAMAAGNCVVLKPSEFAPHTAAAMAKLIGATFPRGIHRRGARASATSPRRCCARGSTRIFFTGSTDVGRAVMTAAARHLTPVTLELGGKCPCLVCADAPLGHHGAAHRLGQVHERRPDLRRAGLRAGGSPRPQPRWSRRLKRAMREFYGDDPQQSPDYGRIINRRHLDRLTGYLGSGQIAHGGQHDAGDLYLAPTILTDVPLDAPVMQEEIFGPILPVLEFDDLDDALALLRDRPTPLALYLFTHDRATQERVLARHPFGRRLPQRHRHAHGRQGPAVWRSGRERPGGLPRPGRASTASRIGVRCCAGRSRSTSSCATRRRASRWRR